MIYQFGTQWQKTGGPKYVVPGSNELDGVKYTDTIKAVRNRDPSNKSWKTILPTKEFDYSWHPDATEPAYIYVFGNQWNSCDIEPTIEYHVEGATQRKYITDIVAKLEFDMSRWEVPDDIDITRFDFSWRPNPTEPPMI